MSRRHAQRGFGLVEVLVATLVAALGLLGLAAVQARSLSMQIDSESRRTALGLLEQLRERVVANPQGFGGALATGYSRIWGPGAPVELLACANPAQCNPVNDVPGVMLTQWMVDVRRQLPTSAVAVGAGVPGTVQSMQITIAWTEPDAEGRVADPACAQIPDVATDTSYRCVTATFFPG